MDKQIEIKRGEGVMVDLLNQEMNELQEGLKQKQDKRLKHGKTGTRLFNIWQNMKERCYCETNPYFQYYGGKGIKICDEWKNNFNSFYDWAMRNGYEESLTIEEIAKIIYKDFQAPSRYIAEQIYNAKYRKESDTAREILAEAKKWVKAHYKDKVTDSFGEREMLFMEAFGCLFEYLKEKYEVK